MHDKHSLFDLSNQPPVIQLFISFFIVIIGGTLLFYSFVFIGSLIFGTEMSDMLPITILHPSLRQVLTLKYIQVSQHIALFAIPAIVITVLLQKEKESFLRTNEMPGLMPVLLVIFLAFLILPVTSYTGMLNSKMNLPVWLSGVEEWMRAKENTASDLTSLLIKSSGIGDLMLNIFILAVIPAIAEEMIFRGVLQQILFRIFRSGHISIWITAILFSAVHFQFFGFLPRLILGLSFGYLFFWTGNLWLAILAHFINNIIPVIFLYFSGWNDFSNKISGLQDKHQLLPFVPVLLSVMIFYFFWAEHRKKLLKHI
jgi:uncharacterized protein